MSSSTRAVSACTYGAGSAAPGSVAAETRNRMGCQLSVVVNGGTSAQRLVSGSQIGDCAWAVRRPPQYASSFPTVHRLVERKRVGEQTQLLACLLDGPG